MAETTPRILVVDDEVDMLETCRRILTRRGYLVDTASSADCAEELLAERPFHLLIADLVLPGKDGLELARIAHRRDASLAVLIITAHATIESALRATREGVLDYIAKPFTMEQLEIAVERALEFGRLHEENVALKRQLETSFELGNMVGKDPAFQRMLELVRKVADTDANILITGESGTGKELVARSIHANSRRRNRRFVPLDCAALPETLFESELVGAERGAYTGAGVSRPGVMEHADGGTLFLDEIGNLAPAMQVKLLRVLQERVVRRLGTTRQIAVDVRLVAATNQDLARLVHTGSFREDLYYRLNVVQIDIPPLRERDDDVELLAQHFVTEFAHRYQKHVRAVSSAATMLLEGYDWPGNVRELRNVIERGVSLTESNQIMPADLPPSLTEQLRRPPPLGEFRAARQAALAEFELTYLRALLERAAGNVSRAATLAGLTRTSLHRLLARHGLEANEFRSPGLSAGRADAAQPSGRPTPPER